jgi:hypothetical protein
MASRVLLVIVGAALVLSGAAWIVLVVKNATEFHNAGGALGVVVYAGLPGVTAVGTGLFLWRLAASRYPGSI